jgi:hypothetical protein
MLVTRLPRESLRDRMYVCVWKQKLHTDQFCLVNSLCDGSVSFVIVYHADQAVATR